MKKAEDPLSGMSTELVAKQSFKVMSVLKNFAQEIRKRLRPISNRVTDDEIELLGPTLLRLAWSDSSTRAKIQQSGANVLPVNFYSNSPSIADIKESYEYKETIPYLDERIFDVSILTTVLEQLSEYSREFKPEAEGDENRCDRFFWNNSQFSYSDAMAYFCFIRKYRPGRIIEIGSGFSTLVGIEATRLNGFGKIFCIEPFPRKFLEQSTNVELVRKKAQELNPNFLNEVLQDGDFLFIDSTHTVKTGSDCLHIYLRLLPQIRRNILVHVHDVALPFGLPMDWLLERQIFWTEQYLLLALLIDNLRTKVLYGSAYHHALNKAQLDLFMNNQWQSGGGSFWFQYNGSKDYRLGAAT